MAHEIVFMWTERDGEKREIAIPLQVRDGNKAPENFTAARNKAIEQGYPGHRGGWWNWMVTDFHDWLVKKGWAK